MIEYAFRPSLFQPVRTIRLDDQALRVRDGDKPERRVPWADIDEVHIQPATTGEDGRPRWTARIGVKGGAPIRIDSTNVRGADDFEHKTDEFAAVLAAIHAALLPRRHEVRFLFGMGSGLNLAWRIALVMAVAVGLFGTIAATIAEEWDALFGTLAFMGTGLSGLAMLRGRRGPVTYDPGGEPPAGIGTAETGT